jgi:hypothetical protein
LPFSIRRFFHSIFSYVFETPEIEDGLPDKFSYWSPGHGTFSTRDEWIREADSAIS